ncbi:hypothetical protein AVHY2522_07615 [Acidovorax sp. SUPP2522]|nr:hypothetical protein AVHY2522_07615 [Acidovorax sp. SUPP2522]
MNAMKNAPRYRRWAGWSALIGMGAIAVWYAFAPTLKGVYISPRHVYRVEYYDASLVQRLIHPDFKIPSFVRLYRIAPETLLGESDVVDLWINGQLYWWLNPPLNAVQVGRDIVFENIPPECIDCPPLPRSAVMP